MIKTNKLISKLFFLAKSGQKSQFQKIINESKITNNYQSLSGTETSLLLYGFKKLNLINQNNLNKLEEIYLNNSNKMTLHDNIMSGWCFKESNNTEIQLKLWETIEKNWNQIESLQSTRPNIGLVAYIAAQVNEKKPEIWRNIAQIFTNTSTFQDERNFMSVLFAFSKMKIIEPKVWLEFEKYIWLKGFNSFKDKNKILIIYSFARNERGSKDFWENCIQIIQSKYFKFLKSEDVQFCAWAFANNNIIDPQLWEYLTDSYMQLWHQVTLADIETMAFSLSKAQKLNQTIWTKFTCKEFPKDNLNLNKQTKYSYEDDLVWIAKHLEDNNQTESQLFRSIYSLFKQNVENNKINYQELKRLYFVLPFFKKDITLFTDQIQQQLINIVKLKTLEIVPDKIGKNEKCLSFLNDLIKISLELIPNNESYIKQLCEVFAMIRWEDLKSSSSQFNYIQSGSQLIFFDKDLILSKLTSKQIYSDLINNVSALIYLIKNIYSYQETKDFFEQFRQYKNSKPDIFIQLTLYTIHKHNLYLISNEYKTFIDILKSIHASPQMQDFLNLIIDLMFNLNLDIVQTLNDKFNIQLNDFVSKQQNNNLEKAKLEQETFVKQSIKRKANLMQEAKQGLIDINIK